MTIPILHSRNANQWIYVYALRSAYNAGFRVYDPSYPLSRDPDIYEKVQRDPTVKHAMEQRQHSVAGRNWIMEPATDDQADKAVARIMERLIKRVEHFSMARYKLSKATMFGRAYQAIDGKRMPLKIDEGGRELNWWVPTFLKDIDPRRIYYRPEWKRDEKGRTQVLSTHLQLYSIERGDWEDLVDPTRYVKLVYDDDEARLGYGRGLLEAIYFYHYAKEVCLKQGLQGLERWAQGLVVAKLDGFREASLETGNNQAVQQATLDAIKISRTQHYIAMDKLDDVEVVHGSGEGHQMVIDFLNYLDNAITRLILGSVLPTGGDMGTGSMARAEVEAEQSTSLIQFDRQMVDECYTRDLVQYVWDLNQANFAELGLGEARIPSFKTVQEEREDPERNARVATTLLAAGIPLRRDEVYRKTGWTQPDVGDEVIEGGAAAGLGMQRPGDFGRESEEQKEGITRRGVPAEERGDTYSARGARAWKRK